MVEQQDRNHNLAFNPGIVKTFWRVKFGALHDQVAFRKANFLELKEIEIIIKMHLQNSGFNTYDLFLCVLVGREKIYGFHMTKVNIVSQEENKQQLANVFFLLVAI